MYWAERYSSLGKLVRYADDFVIICRTQREAQEALQKVKQIMTRLKLTLHPTKTRIVDMNQEGFDFLGFHFHKGKSRNTHKIMPFNWPSQKAMKSVRKKVYEITERKQLSDTPEEVIQSLNPVIRGWRNYFRCGNSTEKLQQLDDYVWHRLRRWASSKKGSRGHWNESVFENWVAQSGLEYFYRSGICVNPRKPQEEGCRRAG
jgi:DNA mismatch repair ATPase MutL